MSVFAPTHFVTVTLSTGSTFTSMIDLGISPRKLVLLIPSMPSGADMRVHVSDSLTGDNYRTYFQGTTNPIALNIASGNSLAAVPIEAPAQFIKVEVTTATTDTAYRFIFAANP